jgi:mitochondrial translocator assembly and maintenance protein 41
MSDDHDNDDGQLQSQASLRALLDRLPQEQVCYAFAYGSGVFSQQRQQRPPQRSKAPEGRTASMTQSDADHGAKDDEEDPTNSHDEASTPPPPPLVDIIVVVREARAFHDVNRRINPSHYPSFWSSSADAADWATWVQCHTLPDYLHPYLHNPQLYFLLTDDGLFKYGVVQLDHLLDDLKNWRYLYLAGRLHKPTVTITTTGNIYGDDNNNSNENDDGTARILVEEAQQLTNLPNALVTALALLQEEEDDDGAVAVAADDVNVFTTIASLSYTGDPRVRFGAEDPHKVQSLVFGGGGGQYINGNHRHYHHLVRWKRLYEPAIRSLEQRGLLSITTTTTTTIQHMQQQPHDGKQWRLEWDREGVRRHLPRALQRHDKNRRTTTATNTTTPLLIRDRLRSIVAPAARYQSLKGLFTVRPQRAWDYVMRKLAKGRRGRRWPLF